MKGHIPGCLPTSPGVSGPVYQRHDKKYNQGIKVDILESTLYEMSSVSSGFWDILAHLTLKTDLYSYN